jgi:hypothetical protein
MRLLDTKTLTLKLFSSNIPDDAILSHTWGSDEDEVTYQEIQSAVAKQRRKRGLQKIARYCCEVVGAKKRPPKKGFQKIARFCEIARRNGYERAWVDTCCIDKSSSAELSEAINSMYQWYQWADVRYVYLEDVSGMNDLNKSRWFTRGWTLLELLTPRSVEFYSGQWNEMGTRVDLRQSIANITGIDERVLQSALKPDQHTAALRMSWAANRETTRVEDAAYCLLGIFEVNMPLLYGEGSKAFHRLQEEIFKVSKGYSLLAWRTPPAISQKREPTGILATAVWNFQKPVDSLQPNGSNNWGFEELQPINWNPYKPSEKAFHWHGRPSKLKFSSSSGEFEPPRVTARGLRTTLPFITAMSPSDKLLRQAHLAFLYCVGKLGGEMACLILHKQGDINASGGRGEYYRAIPGPGVHFVSPESISLEFRTVYIWTKPTVGPKPLFATYMMPAVMLGGAVGAPRVFMPLGNMEMIFLANIQRGPYSVQLVANVSAYEGGPWCLLVEGPSERPAGLWNAIRDRPGFNLEPSSTLGLNATESVHALVKQLPPGWRKLHGDDQFPGQLPRSDLDDPHLVRMVYWFDIQLAGAEAGRLEVHSMRWFSDMEELGKYAQASVPIIPVVSYPTEQR